MLENDFDMNTRDPDGCTVLHYAARAGNAVLCEQVLMKGGNVNAKNNIGMLATCSYIELSQPLNSIILTSNYLLIVIYSLHVYG